jgi:hypothetical protein
MLFRVTQKVTHMGDPMQLLLSFVGHSNGKLRCE